MMQIIFDEKLVPELREKYVILELDTVMQPGMEKPIVLHALIEDVGLDMLPRLPDLIEQHQLLIDTYKSGKWETAEFNAYALKGSWNSDLDEFYDLVIETCLEMRDSNEIWNGIRYTTPID
jgi:hypothetical protein